MVIWRAWLARLTCHICIGNEGQRQNFDALSLTLLPGSNSRYARSPWIFHINLAIITVKRAERGRGITYTRLILPGVQPAARAALMPPHLIVMHPSLPTCIENYSKRLRFDGLIHRGKYVQCIMNKRMGVCTHPSHVMGTHRRESKKPNVKIDSGRMHNT